VNCLVNCAVRYVGTHLAFTVKNELVKRDVEVRDETQTLQKTSRDRLETETIYKRARVTSCLQIIAV